MVAVMKNIREEQSKRRAARRYVFFQLPGMAGLILLLLVLKSWIDLPTWALWAVLAGWIAKDVILFPFVYRSYLPPPHGDDRLLGETGISRERLERSGYVAVRGELWRAELKKGAPPVEKGEPVVVVGMRGLTLVVRPEKGEKTHEHTQ